MTKRSGRERSLDSDHQQEQNLDRNLQPLIQLPELKTKMIPCGIHSGTISLSTLFQGKFAWCSAHALARSSSKQDTLRLSFTSFSALCLLSCYFSSSDDHDHGYGIDNNLLPVAEDFCFWLLLSFIQHAHTHFFISHYGGFRLEWWRFWENWFFMRMNGRKKKHLFN